MKNEFKIGPNFVNSYLSGVEYFAGSILRVMALVLVLMAFVWLALNGKSIINGTVLVDYSNKIYLVYGVLFLCLTGGLFVRILMYSVPKYSFMWFSFHDNEILFFFRRGGREAPHFSLQYSQIVDLIVVRGSAMEAPDQLYRPGEKLAVIRYRNQPTDSLPRMAPLGPKTGGQLKQIIDLLKIRNPKIKCHFRGVPTIE